MRVLLSGCLYGMAALAPLPAPAQTGGLAPDWEVRKSVTALMEHVKRMKPILEQVDPQKWLAQGAPSAYIDQGKRTSAELGYLLGAAQMLADRPDRLTKALETYFRLQSLDLMVRSYAAGVRKYQNAAVADLLLGALGDTVPDRENLRQYIVDLAADKEQEFKVADQEAQRCRSLLSRQPRSTARSAPKPAKEVRP